MKCRVFVSEQFQILDPVCFSLLRDCSLFTTLQWSTRQLLWVCDLELSATGHDWRLCKYR